MDPKLLPPGKGTSLSIVKSEGPLTFHNSTTYLYLSLTSSSSTSITHFTSNCLLSALYYRSIQSPLVLYISLTALISIDHSTLSLSLPQHNQRITMSRITPPVQKFSHAVRSMSSTASRSASVLDRSRHASQYLPRKMADLKAECSKRQLNTTGSKSEVTVNSHPQLHN